MSGDFDENRLIPISANFTSPLALNCCDPQPAHDHQKPTFASRSRWSGQPARTSLGREHKLAGGGKSGLAACSAKRNSNECETNRLQSMTIKRPPKAVPRFGQAMLRVRAIQSAAI